jgi:cation:H+ antiporter
MVEEILESIAAAQGPWGAFVFLIAGGLLLTASVEKLISYLARSATRLNISLFTLALIFTGFEFDDTILALVFASGDMEGVALGTALAIIGITLALAAIIRPFSVDLPTDYVILFGLLPLLLLPFALIGSLTLVHGVILIVAFVLLLGYFVVRELRRGELGFPNSEFGSQVQTDGGMAVPQSISRIPEDRYVRDLPAAGWIWILLAVVALIGIVFASMLLEAGSEVIIEGFGIEETVFGATVLTLILTFET